MSGNLSKIEWDNGHGLEELIAWGTEPIKALARAMQNDTLDEGDISAMAYLIRDKADEMYETIIRFMDEMNKLDEAKKGGA